MEVKDAAGKEACRKFMSADKFIHSVPVPQLYKEASKILLRYEKKEGTLKNLVFNNKRYKNFPRLYATVCKAVDNADIIQTAFSKIKLFEKEPRFNPQLAQVLAGELLFANKVLSGECLPVLTILKYKNELQSAIATVDSTKEKEEKAFEKNPRYVRVNTLLTSAEKVRAQLVEEGWKQITYDVEYVSYVDFLKLVKKLDGKDYMCDYHVPDLLVFPHNTPFWNYWLYKKNYIILQDKASCLPVMLADIPAEAEVIDACAAPGNKTSHLAAIMGNTGKIYAIEKDNKRFQTLTKLLHQRGLTNVEFLNEDFTRLKKDHYENVSHIILDPSCSSTGMNIHQDEVTYERLKKLSHFQASILSFALSFPNVKAVTYSTCSIHEEENEEVVCEALKKFGDKFILENIGKKLKGWKHFGEKKYPFRHLCLKTKLSVDKCHGFFVAKFVRKGECELKKGESKEKKRMNEAFNGVEEELANEKITLCDFAHEIKEDRKISRKSKGSKEAVKKPHSRINGTETGDFVEDSNDPEYALHERLPDFCFDEVLGQNKCEVRKKKKEKGWKTKRKMDLLVDDGDSKETWNASEPYCEVSRGRQKKQDLLVESSEPFHEGGMKTSIEALTHVPIAENELEFECSRDMKRKSSKGNKTQDDTEGIVGKKKRKQIKTVVMPGYTEVVINKITEYETVAENIKKKKKFETDVSLHDASTSVMSALGVECTEETKVEMENKMRTLDSVEECHERLKAKKGSEKCGTDKESLNRREVSSKVPDVHDYGSRAAGEAEEEKRKKKKKRMLKVSDIPCRPSTLLISDFDTEVREYPTAKGMEGNEIMSVSEECPEKTKLKKRKKSGADIASPGTSEITGGILRLPDVEEIVNTVPEAGKGRMDKRRKKKKNKKLEDSAFLHEPNS